MSRLIVKNLPNRIEEEELRQLFGTKGSITDCSLKYTKDGRFRNFAFIGYKTEEEAAAAKKYFDKTYIKASKLTVDIANNLGDKSKPRAWSKYSSESSSFQKANKKETKEMEIEKMKKTKKELKKEAFKEILGDLQDDPEFLEFLDLHKGAGQKPMWSNDAVEIFGLDKDASAGADEKIEFSVTDYSSDRGNKGITKAPQKNNKIVKSEKEKVASTNVSDSEYLKSKVVKGLLSESESEEEEKEKGNDSIEERQSDGEKEKCSSEIALPEQTSKKESTSDQFSMRVSGLKGNYNSKTLREFFKPLKLKAVHIPQSNRNKTIGVAFVEFYAEKDMDRAQVKNKTFINGKKIFLKKSPINLPIANAAKSKPQSSSHMDDLFFPAGPDANDEEIAESGRIFVRNLSFTCTEEDLQNLFGKYGLLVEVNLPINSFSKMVKGFAFITYVIPENAVKAYTELDGTVFQGRMLHILPGKAKKENSEAGGNFKEEKLMKQKALANSSHNWNSLFLGPNAVAEVMAEKYGMSKSHILDMESNESLGVRLALGETQVVSETRSFLIENGVCLDSFSQPAAARSKTVLLVKNLPSSTSPEEIRNVFSKFGTIGRVVLPPSGITAIVEFLEAVEAKRAFTSLAYTKFCHVPLYLEWAPMETFKMPFEAVLEVAPTAREDQQTKALEKNNNADEDSSESDTQAEPESILFVKNLSFDTVEESIRKKFEKCGKIRNVSVARKKDLKNAGKFLSMGYGFVEFKHQSGAQEAMRSLQHTDLDGHRLELKVSNRSTTQARFVARKKQVKKKQTSSKILVRNIPFEAKKKEIKELFSVFGELKTVRLPKKLSENSGEHRGFGFVDFVSRHDAKRALNALCHSTHLYGRRLVLEWANSDETLEDLRKKTAEQFHNELPLKRLKMEDVLGKHIST